MNEHQFFCAVKDKKREIRFFTPNLMLENLSKRKKKQKRHQENFIQDIIVIMKESDGDTRLEAAKTVTEEVN